MAIYIVVHHPRDPCQPWTNSWLDDSRIEAIQTTKEIGHLCEQSRQEGMPVYVHRCAWETHPATVCCAATVAQASPIDRRTYLVTFSVPKIVSSIPPISPAKGQNFYITQAPSLNP